ncbi:MAG: hypothetical protein WCI00_07005 [bacterium]
MLTDTDKVLIEKYLDSQIGPGENPALTKEELIVFNERMEDSDFKDHFSLSNEVNEAIMDNDVIDFRKKLKKAEEIYHKKQ